MMFSLHFFFVILYKIIYLFLQQEKESRKKHQVDGDRRKEEVKIDTLQDRHHRLPCRQRPPLPPARPVMT